MIAMRILTMMTTMIQNQPTVLNTREKHPFFSFPSPLPRLSFLKDEHNPGFCPTVSPHWVFIQADSISNPASDFKGPQKDMTCIGLD